MKIGGFFGVRLNIPFWTKAQEKKAKMEREERERKREIIRSESLAKDRYWKAIQRRIENDKLAYPTIDFPGGKNETR